MLVSGDLATADDALTAGIQVYRPAQRSASAYRIGHDPGTGCMIYRAMTHWLRGYPDRARAGTADAMRLADVIAHPFSEAHVSLFGAIIAQLVMHLQTVKERAAVAAAIPTAAPQTITLDPGLIVGEEGRGRALTNEAGA